MRNLFITFEGIEGCGKSTQARLLKDYLTTQEHVVFLSREPGGPKISEQIRSILLDVENGEMTPETELLLYLAARCQHTAKWIKPVLDRGGIVICDRYFDSTYAYQGIARNMDMEKVKYLNDFATYGLVPDLTFILDLPVELQMYRMLAKKLDRIELESRDFHNSVRSAFLDIAKEGDRYVVLNGRNDIYDIHREVCDIANKRIKELS